MNRQHASEGVGGMSKNMWSLKKLISMKKKMDLHPWRSLRASLISSPFRWKRVKDIHRSFLDSVVFKIVSVCEGVLLVSTVCCFFICCGCHF